MANLLLCFNFFLLLGVIVMLDWLRWMEISLVEFHLCYWQMLYNNTLSFKIQRYVSDECAASSEGY
jgi:hypothetical protein